MHDFDELIPHMKRAGFFATALASVITSRFGWTLGEDAYSSVCFAGLLGLCTFIVGYALTAVYHAYQRQMYAVAAAASLLFGVAVVVEFFSHAGYTAANRDAGIQNAALQTVSYEDKRTDLAMAREKVEKQREAVNALKTERWRPLPNIGGKPVGSAQEAQQAIEYAKSHKWWAYTNECTETKGPQTRKFCAEYREAKAAVAASETRESVQETLSQAEANLAKAEDELRKANSAARTAKTGHAAASSQGNIVASMVTLERKPDDAQMFWAGITISSVIALFAIVAGCGLNFIAYAFTALMPMSAPVAAQVAAFEAPQQMAVSPVERAISNHVDSLKRFSGRVASRSPVDGSVLSLPVNFQPAGA